MLLLRWYAELSVSQHHLIHLRLGADITVSGNSGPQENYMAGWCQGIHETFSLWERQSELLIQDLSIVLNLVICMLVWLIFCFVTAENQVHKFLLWIVQLTKRIIPLPGCSGNQVLGCINGTKVTFTQKSTRTDANRRFPGLKPRPWTGCSRLRGELLSVPRRGFVIWEHPRPDYSHPKAVINRGAPSYCPHLALLGCCVSPKPFVASSDFWRKKRDGSIQRCFWAMCCYRIVSSFFWSCPYSFVQRSPIMQNVPLPKTQEPCEPASCGEGEPETTTAYPWKRKCDRYHLNLCQPGRSRERRGDSD